jgi:hypothetical protein
MFGHTLPAQGSMLEINKEENIKLPFIPLRVAS